MYANNLKIAVNTGILYFRMFLTMGLNLYISRLVLEALGVSDFGIYSVIGGIVILFSFLNTAMSSATRRFLNFEIGKNNYEKIKEVFSASFWIHSGISFVLLILLETIGLWFFYNYLNIPSGRDHASLWVYQFTVVTFILSVLVVPFTSAIIAFNKMSLYAVITIIEVLIKLIFVLTLTYVQSDKLLYYSFFLLMVSVIITTIYICTSLVKIPLCAIIKVHDQRLYRQMISFSGWSLFGGLANVIKSQGINLMLNIFGSVTLNAAVGIANQVASSLNNFVYNFQLAFNPELVQRYASGQKKSFISLIYQSSKFSFFLSFFLSLPVLLMVDPLLMLWLGMVPAFTSVFCRLIVLQVLIEALGGPLWMAVQASGKIKMYQLCLSTVMLLIVPIGYFLMKHGYNPQTVFIANLILVLLAYLVRIIFARILIGIDFFQYLNKVVGRVLLVVIISVPICMIIVKLLPGGGLIILANFCLISIVLVITFLLIGLTVEERKTVSVFLRKYLSK